MRALIIFIPTIALAMLAGGCKQRTDTLTEAKEPPTVPEVLHSNQLDGAPSTFLQAAAKSPVNWQVWSPEVLEHAEQSQRIIFAVIVSSRYPGCFETLETINNKPSIVRSLNNDFLPVLVDVDICRETGLLAAALSAETNQLVSLPFLLLLSHEGAPITWLPIRQRGSKAVVEFFDHTTEVVSRLWRDDPDYVLDDSKRKLTTRKEALLQPYPLIEAAEEQHLRYQIGVRALLSLYDEDLETLSGVGGVFPNTAMEALAIASRSPLLSEAMNSRCRKVVHGSLPHLLNSAIIDPLDGGIYLARQSRIWDHPAHVRNCADQAKFARAAAQIQQITPMPRLLESAENAIKFAEEHYQISGGLFALSGQPGKTPELEWFWTMEQLKDNLNPEELSVWQSISNLDDMGNLPAEASSNGKLFRLNSLSFKHSSDEVANETGLPKSQVASLLNSGRKKLLKAREARCPSPRHDSTPSASACFRMISAYASLYTATGDTIWRDKAVNLGKQSREAFGQSSYLNELPGENPGKMSDGRAFTYGLAIQAALDLGAITLEDEWNLWAHDLLTLLGENFVTDDFNLLETRKIAEVIDLPYHNRRMIFGESTAGLTTISLGRLKSLGFQLPPALRTHPNQLPPIDLAPLLHTDFIKHLGTDSQRQILIVGKDAPIDLKDAVTQLPLELYERRLSLSIGPQVEIRTTDGKRHSVTSNEELTNLQKSSHPE